MKTCVACFSALVLTGFAPLFAGCNSNSVPQPAPIVDGNAPNDPAMMNMATPVNAIYTQTRVPAGTVRYAAVSQAQQSAPQQAGANYGVGNSQQNEAYRYNTQQPQNEQQQAPQEQQQQYASGQPMTSQEYDQYAQLLDPSVPEATQPPPALPSDYEQPEAPGPNYLWTPGYWDYASAGYYYVPGAWVGAPYDGALWTPGWWGYYGHGYRWHHGYWGPHVGYYGGINYGFGFIGFGYQGGYWRDRNFYYNTAVNHVSPRVVNNYVYQRNVTVVNNTYINNTRTSYFGGPNGLHRAPAPQEFAALREQHVPPMQAQIAHRQAAQENRQQFFNANQGRPQMLFAAHAIQADRNIAVPQNRPEPGQNLNGRPGGAFPGGTPEQRQGFEQHQAQTQQLDPREQQRQQLDAQRQQQSPQTNAQRDQQRQQFEAQRQQQGQTNLQRQQTPDQQRFQQQGQPLDAQRQQQENLQRQALDVQRQQQGQNQRQTLDAQRQQQDNAAREQQQRQQQDAQRQQQLQTQQRAQFQQQQNAAREQQAVQQRQQMIQQQSMQQRTAAPPPRVEAPRPAAPPAQHFEAPRAAPAPHVESHPAPAPAGPHR